MNMRAIDEAIQTVPFRDPNCQGFGALFIYNTVTRHSDIVF